MILNLIHSTFGYCYPHYACRKEIMNCFMLKQPFYNSMNRSADNKKRQDFSCRDRMQLLFQFSDQLKADCTVSSLRTAAFATIICPAGVFIGIP